MSGPSLRLAPTPARPLTRPRSPPPRSSRSRAAPTPAEQAALLAQRNGTELIACACDAGSFEATVTVRSAPTDLLLVPRSLTLDVQARAVVDLP